MQEWSPRDWLLRVTWWPWMVVVLPWPWHAIPWRWVGSSITAALTSHTFSVGRAAAAHSVQVCPATQQCVLGAVVLWRSSAAAQQRSSVAFHSPNPHTTTTSNPKSHRRPITLKCSGSVPAVPPLGKIPKPSYHFIERRLSQKCVCVHA